MGPTSHLYVVSSQFLVVASLTAATCVGVSWCICYANAHDSKSLDDDAELLAAATDAELAIEIKARRVQSRATKIELKRYEILTHLFLISRSCVRVCVAGWRRSS